MEMLYRMLVVTVLAAMGCSRATSTSAYGEPTLIGVIASRAPRLIGVADSLGTRVDSIPAMFVRGGPECREQALFFIGSGTRVLIGERLADTSALVVGRRVWVWSGSTILTSCPIQTSARIVRVEK